MSTPEMHRSKRPGWLPSNLLLLAGTVLVGMFLLLLSDLFREDEARSTGVIVVDALAGMLFYGILMYVSALPGGIGYLLLLEKIAQRVSGMRLRALAEPDRRSAPPHFGHRDVASACPGFALWSNRSPPEARAAARSARRELVHRGLELDRRDVNRPSGGR